jgi:hypothetical protein
LSVRKSQTEGAGVTSQLDQPAGDGGENLVEPLTDRHMLGDAPQDIQVPVAVERSQRHVRPRCSMQEFPI